MIAKSMSLDEFIDLFFENLCDQSGIDCVKRTVKEVTDRYEQTDVCFNALGNDNESDRDIDNVEINSEGYDDEEVINIDVLLAEEKKSFG